MPRRRVLIALLVLAAAPPFVAQASGSMVGSFTMFNQLERYHLELWIETAQGKREIPFQSLAPHLSPEAARILLPAEGYAVGADQVDLVAAGLPDLARVGCALHPEAESARVELTRDPFNAQRRSGFSAVRACEKPK
jgi:hypothetical protein